MGLVGLHGVRMMGLSLSPEHLTHANFLEGWLTQLWIGPSPRDNLMETRPLRVESSKMGLGFLSPGLFQRRATHLLVLDSLRCLCGATHFKGEQPVPTALATGGKGSDESTDFVDGGSGKRR